MNKGYLPLLAAVLVLATAGFSLRLRQGNQDAFRGDLDSLDAQVEVLDGGLVSPVERLPRKPGRQPEMADQAGPEPIDGREQKLPLLAADPESSGGMQPGLGTDETYGPSTRRDSNQDPLVYGILDDDAQIRAQTTRPKEVPVRQPAQYPANAVDQESHELYGLAEPDFRQVNRGDPLDRSADSTIRAVPPNSIIREPGVKYRAGAGTERDEENPHSVADLPANSHTGFYGTENSGTGALQTGGLGLPGGSQGEFERSRRAGSPAMGDRWHYTVPGIDPRLPIVPLKLEDFLPTPTGPLMPYDPVRNMQIYDSKQLKNSSSKPVLDIRRPLPQPGQVPEDRRCIIRRPANCPILRLPNSEIA